MSILSRIDSTRTLHMAIIFLQVFSVAQIVWWFVDQRSYAHANAELARKLYNYDLAAAQRMAALNVDAGEITNLFPHVQVEGGIATLKPEALTAVKDDQQRHVNQYAWESGFFLLVQASAIMVLWRGLSGEKEIRRRQDSFLAMVSHQFKTPIASLQLSLETMVKRQLSPERFQQLSRRMLDDLWRMENMVSKILDSARLDRGRVQMNKEQVHLTEAVRHVVATLDDVARRDNITFSIDIAPELQVRADPLAVDGVLRNLIENAMSAMKPTAGGTVSIHGRKANGDVELEIADTGIGFESDQGPKLFEKFFRIDNHGGRDAAGTGLGLFIVQRFMHFESGRVRAHSDGPGKGAVFTVTWPATAEPL
jgi:signal transduction histidine kinase